MQLTTKDLMFLEVVKEYNEKNFQKGLSEYHQIVDALEYLYNTLSDSKAKAEHWQNYNSPLMSKFFFHSYTFYHILCGKELKSKYYPERIDGGKLLLDISSAHIILRAQLEAFLMYHHIYVNPKSDEEKKFRFQIWMYSGLLDRQKFPDNFSFAKQQKARDKKAMNALKIEFENSVWFKKLSERQQRTIISKGEGRLFKSWNDILADTGFTKGHYLPHFYSYLCSHAHSEAVSILQLEQSLSPNGNVLPYLLLDVSRQLICVMIMAIKNIYRAIEVRYNSSLHQSLQYRIEFHSDFAKKQRIQDASSIILVG